MAQISCAGCGNGFDARADARYCSAACRQRAYRQRPIRYEYLAVTDRGRRAEARRIVEHMQTQIQLLVLANSEAAIDPAYLDDAMRDKIADMLSDLTVIRRYLRKAKDSHLGGADAATGF